MYVLIMFLAISIVVLSLAMFNCYLPKWFCDYIGWHLAPEWQGFDGCSFTGTCPRCGKHVLEDSQGNWF